jgi:nitrite reductase/ring-hydroxylating ferredoxin subunit/uncharacterized membrane protein
MANPTPAELIEKQEWLEPVETRVHDAVSTAYQALGRPVTNVLHGVWLGHPLHPVLTDIPLGVWSATLVLDLMEGAGHKSCGPAADLTLKLGLAGAAGAALTGLTDWQAVDGAARRKGLVHGMLNLTATALYTASLFERQRRNRSAGRTLALCGFAISSLAAWIGGDLVYGEGIGVDHSQRPPAGAAWTAVGPLDELIEGTTRRVEVQGVKVLVVRRGDQVHAIGEVCSHLGGPLSEGKLQGDTIQCPWHGSRFCVRDGSVIDGPATHPQPRFEARVREGQLELRPQQSLPAGQDTSAT